MSSLNQAFLLLINMLQALLLLWLVWVVIKNHTDIAHLTDLIQQQHATNPKASDTCSPTASCDTQAQAQDQGSDSGD